MREGMQRSYANAGSLFFFSDNVAPAFKEDVLTCSLYCQLAASAKHGRNTQSADWRQTYLNALTRFRCDILYRNVQSIPVEGERSIWEEAKSELTKRVSFELVQRAENQLTRFSSNSGDAAIRTFLREQTTQTLADAQPSSNATLLLGFVDAEPVINMMLLSFESTRPYDELPFSQLFTRHRRVGNLAMTAIAAELDEHGFGFFRQGIIERLGARRGQLIMPLDEVAS